MLFSEKMTQIPQPQRAELWKEYRTLCTALALNVTLRKENREARDAELSPLREAAKRADVILTEEGFAPSFAPDEEDFFPRLLNELNEIMKNPSSKD